MMEFGAVITVSNLVKLKMAQPLQISRNAIVFVVKDCPKVQ
jgi:hypothetical protein